jgi:hypothetical protein
MGKPERESIREDVKKLVKELRRTWLINDAPYELYHYTDSKGLLGILTGKSFWATDINFLNDAMELKYASELINRILDTKIEQSNDERLGGFWDNSQLYLKLHAGMMNAYVTCFCENGNLLSQWRAYGGHGAGYSIGVITKSLTSDEPDGPGTPVVATRLRKVIYNKDVQERLVMETVNKFFDLLLRSLEQLDNQDRDLIITELTNNLSAELSEYLYCFKSPVFEEEQEWRVIHTFMYHPYDTCNNALKLRASGGNIVPYIEANFAAPPTQQLVARGYPISSIVYGPSLHPELTERSLFILLESTLGHGNGVNITSSDIPLRNINS